MAPWSRIARFAVLALAALVLAPLPALAAGAPASAAAPAAGTAAPAAVPAATLHPASEALLAATHAAMASDGIAADRVLLPNFNAQVSTAGGYVHPIYPSAPSPMGLGYFGVTKVGSRNVGSISYTSSVEAQVTMNGVTPFYLASTSPDIFTMQLNTVATNVDVLGNTSYQYWIQNVPLYFADSQTLGFEDNIWNFSAPGAGMQYGTLYNYSGYLVAPEFYYAVGPSFHMPAPFTVTLYNNLTVTNLRPTVWFNYSITTSTGSVISGSYDRVEFNSNPAPTRAAPKPVFQINGVSTNPIGLLNDAEIMLGGPGGGSTTTILNINATMGLWLKSNRTGHYVDVPAGFSTGTDTGETSEGIAEYASSGPNPVAVLGSGPSILQPLWGYVGTTPGYVQETVTLSPSNAFAFANAGTSFQTATASWAPVPPSGTAVYRLAAGHSYTFEFLLSDYKPRTVTLTGSSAISVSLRYDAAMGVYTPLWAWDNAQLAAISLPGGNGSLANPYVLDNVAYGPLSPLFGEFNDYYFFVFPGLLIANTNAYVSATGLPDFSVSFTITPEAQFSSAYGTPYSDNLQLQFYNTSHLSLAYNAQITGWGYYVNSYYSSVLFWNSSNDLVAGNDFQVQGLGLQLFGGTNNVVWGNVFTVATTTAVNPGSIAGYSAETSMLLYESGDLVFNNYFDTVYTAYTPTFNLYSGAFAIWSDRWNVSTQKATANHYVNGYDLTGSILGLPTVNGNWWSDYGTPGNPYGVLPYDEYGAITIGGDYHPLLTYAIYKITFQALNLTAGATTWSVTIDGYTQYTSGTSLVFWEPAGTYAFTVGATSPYVAHPAKGAITLTTHGVKRDIRWT